jgi:pimeloyl-ACP methyl ester carboxylesterase
MLREIRAGRRPHQGDRLVGVFRSDAGRKRVLEVYDRVLARWPVSCDTMMVSTRYGATHVIAGGPVSAPPLLLLHGTGSNSLFWAGDMPRLAERFRVYAVDIPGEPGKSEPIRSPWQGPAYAEWLADFLTALNLERVSLLGVSIGAFLALKFAAACPGKVEKLILVSSSGLSRQRISFLFRALFWMTFGARGLERIAAIVTAGVRLPAEARDYMTLLAEHSRPRLETVPLFSDAELQRLTMPVLAIAGRRDALLDTAASLRRLHETVPHAETIELPEAGHVVTGQIGRILAFLSAPA